MLKYLTYCVSSDYPPIRARPVYSRKIEKERGKKGRFVWTSRRRRHPINRSFYQDWHFPCPVERRVLCRRTPSEPIRTKKAGQTSCRLFWQWGSSNTETDWEKKKSHHYANPSNGEGPGCWSLFGEWKDRLQASHLAQLRGEETKVVSNVGLTYSEVNEGTGGCYRM